MLDRGYALSRFPVVAPARLWDTLKRLVMVIVGAAYS